MMESHELAAGLPSPRRDEPANLRVDIFDELADHLACAERRERLAGGDCSDAAVQNRVRDKFGDPAVVALTLWKDALWRRIMVQRVLIGTCVLLALAFVGSFAFSWVMLNRQQLLLLEMREQGEFDRRVIADMEARNQQRDQQLRDELAEARRVEAAARMQAEQARDEAQRAALAAEKSANSDWNPVEFRFVADSNDGPPLVGVKVDFAIKAAETGIPPLKAESGTDGIVRFPRVRYGIYWLAVTAPNHEVLSESIQLQPGEGLNRTIVCPTAPLENAPVQIRIAWPEELAVRQLDGVIDNYGCTHTVDDAQWVYRQGIAPRKPFPDPNLVSQSDLLILSDGSPNRRVQHGFASFSPPNSPPEPPDSASLSRLFPRRIFVPDRRQPSLPGDIFVWSGMGYQFAAIEIYSPYDLKGVDGYIEHNKYRVRRKLTSLKGNQVNYRFERADGDEKPATLWIEPKPEAIEALQKAIESFDDLVAKAKKAQESQSEQK